MEIVARAAEVTIETCCGVWWKLDLCWWFECQSIVNYKMGFILSKNKTVEDAPDESVSYCEEGFKKLQADKVNTIFWLVDTNNTDLWLVDRSVSHCWRNISLRRLWLNWKQRRLQSLTQTWRHMCILLLKILKAKGIWEFYPKN